MLESGFGVRHHSVEVWYPKPRLRSLFGGFPGLKKWAGYVDQYLVFSLELFIKSRRTANDTIFAYCDQALGPLIPIVASRPSVIHTHDLLALKSALGKFPENRVRFSGKIYQRLIRWGFQHGGKFICVSQKTQRDLLELSCIAPSRTSVVYNGLSFPFYRLSEDSSSARLAEAEIASPPVGFFLHVGSGTWYKNTQGVIAIYSSYIRDETDPPELWIVGQDHDEAVKSALLKVPEHGRVRFLKGIDDLTLQALYSKALAFLFPSLEEGFGWPIIESQSCGCLVVTTDGEPMREVGGNAPVYIPRYTLHQSMEEWSRHAAVLLSNLLQEPEALLLRRRTQGVEWSRKFDGEAAIDAYLAHYRDTLIDFPR